jgi:hypothetical protein
MDRLYDVVCLENSVHDGDFLSRDLVDGDVADLVARVRWVDEKKEVPAVESWFHGAAISFRGGDALSRRVREGEFIEGKIGAPEDDNDWRLGVRDQSETLINHKA